MDKTKLKPFEQALLDITLEAFADIPSEEEIELEFSDLFLSNNEKLIEKNRRGGFSGASKTIRRIILVAALIAALATTAMAVPAIREALIKFFAQSAETHYEFYFDPEQAATAPENIEKVYKPTYIPEGFHEDFAFVDLGVVSYLWSSDAGEYITFDQLPIPNDTEGPAPDAEDVTVETINLNGYQVFVVYGEITMYYWTDNEYFYALCVPTSVSQEEQYNIFYSIALDENAVIPEP